MRGMAPRLAIELTADERSTLEDRARQRVAPYCEVVRAKALLMAADGMRNVEIAAKVDSDPRTVSIWRREFRLRGIDSLVDRPRPGAPRTFSP
jgi:transposase